MNSHKGPHNRDFKADRVTEGLWSSFWRYKSQELVFLKGSLVVFQTEDGAAARFCFRSVFIGFHVLTVNKMSRCIWWERQSRSDLQTLCSRFSFLQQDLKKESDFLFQGYLPQTFIEMCVFWCLHVLQKLDERRLKPRKEIWFRCQESAEIFLAAPADIAAHWSCFERKLRWLKATD